MKEALHNRNGAVIGKFDMKRVTLIIVAAIVVGLFTHWLGLRSTDRGLEAMIEPAPYTLPSPTVTKQIDAPAPDATKKKPAAASDEEVVEVKAVRPPAGVKGGGSVAMPYNAYRNGGTMNPYALQEHFGTQDMAAPNPDAQKTYAKGHDKLKESMQKLR
ncbi:hypothetical protein MNBD_GAMMA13-1493 [hydrothermal vent metagenome]|uniref:Uncharacterized protein n=1 Tax=hydrothermal vent metagenome TaxID=652676 RepID=A0A3B0ZRD5_9ZZZZ